MAGTLNYVDIDNLKAFWGKAKEYINTKVSTDIANIKGTGITVGGSGDYKASTVEAAITALDGRVDSVESRVATAETYVQDVNVNNTSTASTKYVTISCTDDNDATSKGKQTLITIDDKAVADKFAEIDAKSIVSSVVTTDGTYVKLTPNEAKSGAVNITVDDSAIGTIAGDVSAIKNYTVNGATISGNPTLNAKDIPYSSDTDTTSTHDKIESLDGVVSAINDSYVKSVKGEGVNVTVTPDTARNGDVTVKVDASALASRIAALEQATPVTTIDGDTNNTYVNISFTKDGNKVTATVDDSKVVNVVSGYIHDIAVTNNATYVSLTETESGGVSTLTLTDSIGDALKGKSNTGHGHAATEVSITTAIDNSALNVQSALTKLHGLVQSMAAGTQVVAVLGSLPSNTTGYKVGDIVVVGNKEYLCAPSAVGSSTNSWHLLGDVTQEAQKITAIETLLATAPSLSVDGNTVKVTAYGKTSASGITVPYATAAGTATVADKLGSDAGSATNPVYFTGGKPVACTYSLGKNVPSNALFTDTALGYTFKTLAENSHSGWTNGTTDNKIIPTMSLIAYWNGAYSSAGASNLKYCVNGTIIGSNNIGSQTVNHASTSGTASKLGATTLGSATKGIYLNAGTPTECSFSVGKSVPSDAVFTDTKNTAGSSKDTGTLYLIGAKTQETSAQTYTSSTAVTVTNGNVTASDFITTSDRRLKKNIVEVTDEMLEKSLGLNVYEFDYRNNDEHSVGYIAQEVQEVLPEMVKENKCSDGEEFLAVKYTPIHTMQIKALNNKVNQLTTENKELKERLEKLEKLVEKLM